MERWRSFFETSKSDIWSVIHHAITVAATDYPKDFRERRDRIAETLFDRSLLQKHVREDSDLICEVAEGGRDIPACMLKAATNAGIIAKSARFHDDAEALSYELEEEALILQDLHGIKMTLADTDQPESVILEALQRLQYMQITVDNLKATEIGKHVRSLKKHPSQRVKAITKELMRRWKVLIDEWISSAKDVTAMATIASPRTDRGDLLHDGKHQSGLLTPPLDEAALLETGAPDMDLSQLFNFMDGEDLCRDIVGSHITSNAIHPSAKNNLTYLRMPQSGSMLTESNDLDTKASTGHSWSGVAIPEDRGSATRDMYPPSGKREREGASLKREVSHWGKTSIDNGVQVSKTIANGSGPGRPCHEISTAKAFVDARNNHVLQNSQTTNVSDVDRSCAGANPTTDSNTLDQSNVVRNADKSHGMQKQIDQKLEMAKRKLHQGYQQAQIAKKQRTVQILNRSDLPISNEVGKAKMNTHARNKEPVLSGHGGRAKMNAPKHTKEVMRAKMNATVCNKACVPSGQSSQSRKFA